MKAAIFDVDGTLMRGSTERIFIRYLIERGEIGIGRLLATIPASLKGNPFLASKRNKLYLKGMEVQKGRDLALRCFRERILPRLSPLMREVVEGHSREGAWIILLTGSLDFLVEPLRAYLKAHRAIATRLEVRDGRFTGRIDGVHPYGREKVRLLRGVAEGGRVDFSISYAYGDSFSDRGVLGVVGNPVAVNPDPLLRLLADRKGWKILHY